VEKTPEPGTHLAHPEIEWDIRHLIWGNDRGVKIGLQKGWMYPRAILNRRQQKNEEKN